MPGEAAFTTPRLRAFPLDSRDGEQLQALLERSGDFYQLVYGHPPGPAEAQSLFVSLPEGKGYEDKFLLGLRNGSGDLVGVLDAIRDFVETGRWALGLLVIDPTRRNEGLGTEAYLGFELWARDLGARLVRVVVQRQNPGARRFWDRLGFSAVEQQRRVVGTLESEVDILARRLDVEAG